jgi:hypothetical protein
MGQGFHAVSPEPVHAPDSENRKYDSAQNTASQGRIRKIHPLHGGDIAAVAAGIQRPVDCQTRNRREGGHENRQPSKAVLEQSGQLQRKLPQGVHCIASLEMR